MTHRCNCQYCGYMNTAEDECYIIDEHEKYKEYLQWKSEWNGDDPAPQEHMTYEDWLQQEDK